MHRPNQAHQRLLTAALAGLAVACSLEIDESPVSGTSPSSLPPAEAGRGSGAQESDRIGSTIHSSGRSSVPRSSRAGAGSSRAGGRDRLRRAESAAKTRGLFF